MSSVTCAGLILLRLYLILRSHLDFGCILSYSFVKSFLYRPLEHLAQLLHGQADPGFNRAQGLSGGICNFLVAEPVEECQGQGLPLFFWQLSDCLADDMTLDVVFRLGNHVKRVGQLWAIPFFI